MTEAFDNLLNDARACTLCCAHLPEGPRPVFQASKSARVLIAGQAPGIRVHNTGVPFNDPSGERLRAWMGVDSDLFYDEQRVAIIPMGFCYPGTGKSGDLPPRPECAEKWRSDMLAGLSKVELTLAIGQYAIKWHLRGTQEKTLTKTVQNWRNYIADGVIPLPHPSPRNNIWLKKNPWFEDEIIPEVQNRVRELIKA
jgi:uracil-DNA glycosylase